MRRGEKLVEEERRSRTADSRSAARSGAHLHRGLGAKVSVAFINHSRIIFFSSLSQFFVFEVFVF